MGSIIDIIVNVCRAGQKKAGVESGGDIIIENLSRNLQERVRIHRIDSYNNSTLPFDSIGYRECNDLIMRLEMENKRWISLGGDHSTAVSTIEPLLRKYEDDLLVVWIDAHTDINTFETSNSKNSHGMPVAYLMGLMKEKPRYELKPENLMFIGIRDVEPAEQDFLGTLGIPFFTDYQPYHNLSSKSGRIDLDKIVGHILQSKKSQIHFSIDIDGCDPTEMPSTGTAVTGGLSVDFVMELIRMVNSIQKIHSFDIVEYNPQIGTKIDNIVTLSNILRIFDLIITI